MKEHCLPAHENCRRRRPLPPRRRIQLRPLLFVAAFAAVSILALSYRTGHAQSGGTTVPKPQIYLPFVVGAEALHQYDTIPVQGPPIDRPPPVNGDVNLNLRGYVDTDSHLGLVDIQGPADRDAPQLALLINWETRDTFTLGGDTGNPGGWGSIWGGTVYSTLETGVGVDVGQHVDWYGSLWAYDTVDLADHSRYSYVVPTPSAFLLGAMGLGLVGWANRRRGIRVG